MRVYLRWKGPALDITLRDPRGVLHGAESAGSAEGVEYVELGFAEFAGYAIDDALTGAWTVTLSSSDAHTSPSQYGVYAEWPDTDVRLRGEVGGQWVPVGATVTITDTVQGPAETQASALSGDVYAPSGARQALTFERVTAPAGGAARYVAKYVPREAGYHSVLLTALGTHAGRAFERGARVSVTVRGEGARIVGVEAPIGSGVTGSGLVAPVDLAVAAAGEYLLTLSLAEEGRDERLIVAHPVRLAEGSPRVEVPLSGLALRSGAWYWLRQAMLTDIAGAGVLVDETAPGAGWRFYYD